VSLLNPVGDYLVAVNEEAQTKTTSGIFLPEQAQEKPKTAKVIAVGEQAKQIKKGDRIVYKAYSNTDIKIDGKEYVLVKEEDVLATVK
jgi:chaperonin GroES